MRAALVGRRVGQAALLAAALTVLDFGAYYVVQCIVVLILFSSIVGSHNIVEDSAKNERGDEVLASTEATGNWRDPDKTVIRLRRAHHWFWTTLLETESFGIHEDLKWRNEDALDIMLDFGCLTHVTEPVEQVGSIRISYTLSDRDSTLAKGCPD
jgi:hypothetical protein